jgi:tRNA threonylcarbamoyladenosine biosynthesis protein TsaB
VTPPPAAAPVLLAFDTATETLAVALCAHGRTWLHTGPGGAAASAALLPAAQALLAQAGLAMAQVQGVAFGRGPGAFTGLRTSCAVAQGLALGLGCPVWPLDSLLVVAEDARAQLGVPDTETLDLAVAMDARMDEIYAGRWRWAQGVWTPLMDPVLTTPAALVADWAASPPQAVVGSALAAFGERLPLPPGGRALPAEHNRAAALARLALAAWRAGPGLDAAQALPLYLRDKVAQTTAQRAAARAEAAAAADVVEASR